MPKPDSLQGSLDLLVLKILSRRARLHAYAIALFAALPAVIRAVRIDPVIMLRAE